MPGGPFVAALKALFWCALAAEVAWLILASVASEVALAPIAEALDRESRDSSTC